MTAPSAGNVLLRAALHERGLTSQRDFVDALIAAARTAGLGELSLNTRTVRRWESASPGWPRRHYIRALEALFGTDIEELGFTRPHSSSRPAEVSTGAPLGTPSVHSAAATPPLPLNTPLDEAVIRSYQTLTITYRQLYGPLPGNALADVVAQHAALGSRLLTTPTTEYHQELAAAVSDAWLLAARIQLFDTFDVSAAGINLHQALRTAHSAADPARGAAVLAHSALAAAQAESPAQGLEPQELIRAARAFATRSDEPPRLLAWLDIAEADIELRIGDPARAATLVAHAEQLFNHAAEPAWLDWLHPHLLATMKADILLALGRDTEAISVLQRLAREAGTPRQRAIAHADLAAIYAAQNDPETACTQLDEALDVLSGAWYDSVDTRIRQVRAQLEPWNTSPFVTAFDLRFYTWTAALEATRR